jgi:hypothetical protein
LHKLRRLLSSTDGHFAGKKGRREPPFFVARLVLGEEHSVSPAGTYQFYFLVGSVVMIEQVFLQRVARHGSRVAGFFLDTTFLRLL